MSTRAISRELIDLGERIRKRRQELHWSQEKLAEEADICVNTVSRVEGGQSAMSVKIFRKLVRTLAINANELLGESGFAQEESGQFQRMAYRIQHLKDCDQEIVFQTIETLINSLYRH